VARHRHRQRRHVLQRGPAADGALRKKIVISTQGKFVDAPCCKIISRKTCIKHI
jgi:hypothetical protein